MTGPPLRAKVSASPSAEVLLSHVTQPGSGWWQGASPDAENAVLRGVAFAGEWQYSRLLAALPTADRQRLCAQAECVYLRQGQTLYEADAPLQWVYFPTTALVSLSTPDGVDLSFEVATVGREGVVGLPLLSGNFTRSRAVVQIPGKAIRVRASVLADEISSQPQIRRLLLAYSQALVVEIMQTALCGRLHPLEQQVARVILLRMERLQSEQLSMTQESIAGLLGVRRESVTGAAAKLQQAGGMRYTRGRITMLDRGGLEGRACACHRTIRGEFERLLSLQSAD
ncbi:MAG: Crp/Fnr family transcriptional regulator [Massilia sp.]|nr:MAG: Crp/Fnr family transcriptional regulator [Massilia sp.]